jgi:glyoxylase-like metal-dependent hydrolase (beta-lactamase superfamily II)
MTAPAAAEAAGAATLHGAAPTFASGLVEVAPGAYAWLHPNGDWGESNAGLIVGDRASALIDTAWDLRLTRRLLGDVEAVTTDAPIRHLLLTHADGDHAFGAELVHGAELIASREAAAELAHEHPGALHRSALGARLLARVGLGAPRRFGAYVHWMLGAFDFRGITVRRPDRTFHDTLELTVGGRVVRLRRLGPAHTAGDTIVHLPETRTVFAGDLLFSGVTPNGWAGEIDRWREAIAEIAALAPAAIVPGHGPVSDLADLERLDRYWAWIQERGAALLAAGHSVDETAYRLVTSEEFAAAPWGTWTCPERTVCNVIVVDRARRGLPTAIGVRERPQVLWRVAALAHRLGQTRAR